jgi:hypothetical protein
VICCGDPEPVPDEADWPLRLQVQTNVLKGI